MDLELAGKACVVTGASRGIGLATARALATEGARVLLVARGEEALKSAVVECGDAATGLAADVTEPGAGERIVAGCRERLDGIDILVNNAGTSWLRPLEELGDEDWEAQWRLNVMGPLSLMRAAAPVMADAGWGRIVNVCSSSGKRPSLRNAAYSVTKAAQLSLSRVFADAYAQRGVLVNAVAPGVVESDLWTGPGGLADQTAEHEGISHGQALEDVARKVPLGRMGTEDEIAAVIVFLCSERASNVTGAAWSVDGGAVPIIL